MKYKTFLTLLALAAVAIAPVAYAQEIVTETPVTPTVTVALTPEQTMQIELADLQAKELDPTIGSFTKFFIRLKIRQLETQLNIKKALE